MNRIDGKITNLEKNFSRMKAAQNNEKSNYEDTWIKAAIEAAMDVRVLLHIEMKASGKPNKEIEERIYNCFLNNGNSGKKPAAETKKPEPAEEKPDKPAAEDKPAAGEARAKVCDAAKKTSKECEEIAAEEAKEKKRKEREEKERAEEAAKEAER